MLMVTPHPPAPHPASFMDIRNLTFPVFIQNTINKIETKKLYVRFSLYTPLLPQTS